jgi:hypothetical protein
MKQPVNEQDRTGRSRASTRLLRAFQIQQIDSVLVCDKLMSSSIKLVMQFRWR